MKLKQLFLFGLSFIFFIATVAFGTQTVNAEVAKSKSIYKYIQAIREMPYLPANYQYVDWKDKATKFNDLLFDMNNHDLMFGEAVSENTGRETLGIVTYTDEKRDTKTTQALTLMSALLSAEKLNKESIGQDKLQELVQFVEAYYNIQNGEGTLLNYQDIDSTELSFWQQIYPALMYFMLMDRYEATIDSDAMLRNIADTWYEVTMDLGGSDGIVDFGYTGYDFKNKKPFDNGEWTEPDAAAGVALLEYYAFQKFNDRKYMKAASLCMNYLDEFQRNPGYELLYLYLPYLSARLNAVEDYNFNTAKYMEFFFTQSDYRHEYGVLKEGYGAGLIGERTQYGGSPYSFQSIVGATALVPMLKYDQRYAVEVGKYLLNLTQNLNLFYEINDPTYQDLIPTEKVEKDRETSDQKLSVLSGTYLGLLGAMIEPTNIDGILKVDLNTNEYYIDEARQYPSFLMFNPHEDEKTVTYEIQSEGKVDLYDMVSHSFIAQNVMNKTEINIKSTDAVIILEIPIEAGDNQFKIDRKVERSVTANVKASVNIVGISEYEPIADNYPIDLEIKSTDDTAVSNITIYVDGKPVFKNVTYTKPYTVEVDQLANGYHILEAEITTNTGAKDHSYARIFIQKEDNPYIINDHAHDIANWSSYQNGYANLIEENKEIRIGGATGSGVISQPFEIDFSQVPMLDLQVGGFTGPWSLIVKDVTNNQDFYLLHNSTESGHIIVPINYNLNKLNQSTFHLLGKHEIQLAIVTDEDDQEVVLQNVRIFNQGLQPLEERQWKQSFTTQKITHWQSRLNALAKINYYHGTANVLNLNPDGNGGMQTGYFEVDLTKNPQFKIKVQEVDELWSLLVYVESSDRGYYLQYPTDKTGTFTYDIDKVLEKAIPKEELDNHLNLQFWVVSNGQYGSEVKLDYLRMEYSKNWLEILAIGGIALLSVIGICVNLNKDR